MINFRLELKLTESKKVYKLVGMKLKHVIRCLKQTEKNQTKPKTIITWNQGLSQSSPLIKEIEYF